MAISSKNPKHVRRGGSSSATGRNSVAAEKEMTDCMECGGRAVVTRGPVQLEELSAVMVEAEVHTCPKGHKFTGFTAILKTYQAISEKLISKTTPLTGEEIRFLRKHVGMSSKNFAAFMMVTPETASKWEHDKMPMTALYEKRLRARVAQGAAFIDYEIRPARKLVSMRMVLGAA
jgi:DNA-binding transcriptional regulator YiaG